MPPRPPSERIKSTILPPDPEPIPDSAPILDPEQTPEPEPIPRPATAPSLPDGITLSLAGSPVSMERLRTRTAEEAGTETVQVQAAATIPYRDVKDVLEKLHDLGYLVEFVPQESP